MIAVRPASVRDPLEDLLRRRRDPNVRDGPVVARVGDHVGLRKERGIGFGELGRSRDHADLSEALRGQIDLGIREVEVVREGQDGQGDTDF